MRIRLLTAWRDEERSREYRLGEICRVPDDLAFDLAKRLLKAGHAATLLDEPETAMVGGDREQAMLSAGRPRNSKRSK